METNANPQDIKHIREEEDRDKRFLIRPSDDDLFVRTGKQVISHCQLGIGIEAWLQEVESLLEEASGWCNQQEAVRACYVAPLRSRVTLFVLPKSENYNFDLGDALAELNTSLVRKYNVGIVEMRQIPWDEQDRFIKADASRLIYGEPGPTHQSVAS